jgi:hypothetical protein
MISRARLFEAEEAETAVEIKLLSALSYRWHAAFLVTYAIEFMCLSAALLMVLDRMSVFAAPDMPRRWALAGRVVMAAVVLGNAVGLAANAAAAVYYQSAAQATSTSSAAYAANKTTTGRALRQHVVVTTALVFAAFLLRSVFSTMFAVSFLLRDAPADCLGFCDTSCRNVYSVIQFWMTYTPEFQLMVMLISSPAALLVALWGMASKPSLRLMTSGKQHKIDFQRILLMIVKDDEQSKVFVMSSADENYRCLVQAFHNTETAKKILHPRPQ